MFLALLCAAPLAAQPSPVAATLPAVQPQPPVPGTRGPEVVEFEAASDDFELTAWFYPPKGNERAPAALLVHDAGGDKSQLAIYAEKLNAQGFAVLVPDLRGHGESTSEQLSWSAADDRARRKIWIFAQRDLQGAAEWLRKNDRVHSTNLNLMGLRAGSVLVASHAKDDTNAHSLVLLDPPADEADCYGFELAEDIAEAEGLETLMVTPRGERSNAEVIVDIAEGEAYIQIAVAKGERDELLHDSKQAIEVARWTREQAFPRKGKGSSR